MNDWMTATHTPNSTCACGANALMTFTRQGNTLSVCAKHAIEMMNHIAGKAKA